MSASIVSSLAGHRFEHHRVALIARDDAVKALELFGAIDGQAQFLDFKSPGVAYHAPGYFGLGMVAGEAEIGVELGDPCARRIDVTLNGMKIGMRDAAD